MNDLEYTVHRHPDGSIDFDFYRRGATALRRQAIQEAFRFGPGLKVAIAATAALALAIAVVASVPGQLV
jgi:hypothetical protein